MHEWEAFELLLKSFFHYRRRIAGHYVTQDIEEEYLSILEQSTRTKDRVLADLESTDSTEALSSALPR